MDNCSCAPYQGHPFKALLAITAGMRSIIILCFKFCATGTKYKIIALVKIGYQVIRRKWGSNVGLSMFLTDCTPNLSGRPGTLGSTTSHYFGHLRPKHETGDTILVFFPLFTLATALQTAHRIPPCHLYLSSYSLTQHIAGLEDEDRSCCHGTRATPTPLASAELQRKEMDISDGATAEHH